MAEPKKKEREEDLSTADLAGRGASEHNVIHKVGESNRPQLVSSGTPVAPHRAVDRTEEELSTPLFSESDLGDLRQRWMRVQTGFVDEPRKAVQEADNLVAAVMKRLAEGFAKERGDLEKQWDRGDEVSTEELRVALRRYRSFFDRLLNA